LRKIFGAYEFMTLALIFFYKSPKDYESVLREKTILKATSQ